MAREYPMHGEPIDRRRRDNPAIKDLATEVFDNGRRGAPKPGCDCVQCFGYCMVDQDAYARETRLGGRSADQQQSIALLRAVHPSLEGWDE